MIAPLTLHLMLAASLALGPAVDPSTCAPTDHRCMADTNLAAARAETSDSARVHRLYRAHRSFLALARATAPDDRAGPLCRAAELLGQIQVLQPPASLGKPLANTTKETKEALAGVDCSPKKRRKVSGRRVEVRAPTATTTASASPPPTASEETPVLMGVRARRPADMNRVAPSPAAAPAPPDRHDDARPGVTSMTAASPEIAVVASPGQRLQIGGGIAMVAGVALGGAATYLGTRAARARQAGVELAATETGAAAREEGLALQDEFRTFGTVGVAVAVVGGAAIVAGMTMLIVGSQRNARAREREAILLPARTGLLLSVKF